MLKEIVNALNYRNLDDVPEFKGKNTTTEFLTKHVFDRLADAAKTGKLGRAAGELKAIRVTLSRIACGARVVRGAAVVKRVAFAVPGDLDTPTGGYAYDKRIIAELRALGWQVDVIDLGSAFPYPDAATRAAALAKLQSAAEGQPIVVDGLAFGAMAEEAELLRSVIRWSRWCIIRWRWRPGSIAPRPGASRRANAPRSPARGR